MWERFTSADMLINRDLFCYCNNNPIINTDYDGNKPEIRNYIKCPPGKQLGILSKCIDNYYALDNNEIVTVERGQEIYNVGCPGDSNYRYFTLIPDKDAQTYYLQGGYIYSTEPDSYIDYFGSNPARWRDKSDAVYNIQMALYILNKLEYSAVCGEYGLKTETGIKAFQHEHGLKEDGLVGYETGTALFQDVYNALNGELNEDGRFHVLH